MRREAEHVEGFSPNWPRDRRLTQGAGRAGGRPADLGTIVNASLARWISRYRDLPLKVNQWANAVRWELRPRLFLRSTEFLWQEGHTAHATVEEAHAFALEILEHAYAATMEQDVAIPVARPQDGAREVRRRRRLLDVREPDARRQGAADGHLARARAELRPRLRHLLYRCTRQIAGMATAMRDRLVRRVRTIEEAAEQARDGAARMPWARWGPRENAACSSTASRSAASSVTETAPCTTPTATASTRSSRAPTERVRTGLEPAAAGTTSRSDGCA